jgi:sugar phosphate permease
MIFVGLAWLTRLTATSGYPELLGPLILLALGMGQCFVPLTTTAVAGVSADETGLASALLNTAQQIGGAVGLSVLGTVAASVTRTRLAAAHGHLVYTDAFIVAAGLALVALLVSVVVIRVKGQARVPTAVPPRNLELAVLPIPASS